MIITNIGVHFTQINSAYILSTWRRRRIFFGICYLGGRKGQDL